MFFLQERRRRVVAQLVEHRSPKPAVVGSSPSCPAGQAVYTAAPELTFDNRMVRQKGGRARVHRARDADRPHSGETHVGYGSLTVNQAAPVFGGSIPSSPTFGPVAPTAEQDLCKVMVRSSNLLRSTSWRQGGGLSSPPLAQQGHASVAEQVDAPASNPGGHRSWGFDPLRSHHALLAQLAEQATLNRKVVGSEPTERTGRDTVTSRRNGMWRSLVARPVWGRKVQGSKPCIPTRQQVQSGVAQLAAQVILGHKAGGSNPPSGTGSSSPLQYDSGL